MKDAIIFPFDFPFDIVIYSTESVEVFVSCFADINNMLIKGKLIINNYN